MVKKSKTETTRGAWKRTTISIDPKLTLNDLVATGSAEAMVTKLQPLADEVQKLRPPGATPEARVRKQFAQLRRFALQVFAGEGYPTAPGWYCRDAELGWVAVSPRAMKLRSRSGKAYVFSSWPDFDDIEVQSRADIARNMIMAVDQFVRVFDALSKAKRQNRIEVDPVSLPDHVRIAQLTMPLMAAYATFRAEVSNMADAAETGLRTREGAAKGGKDKSKSYGGVELWQREADKIWAKRPKLSNTAVATLIVDLMRLGKVRVNIIPQIGTVAKKIVKSPKQADEGA